MTEYLAFRGPDDQRVRAMEHVGFGHALLKLTEESAPRSSLSRSTAGDGSSPTREWMGGRISSPNSERGSRSQAPAMPRMRN